MIRNLSQARFSHEDLNNGDRSNMDRLGLTEDQYIQRKQNAQKLGWGLVKGTGVALMATSPYVADVAHQITATGQAVYDKWNYEPTSHDTNKTHIEVHLDQDPKQSQITVHTPAAQPPAPSQGN